MGRLMTSCGKTLRDAYAAQPVRIVGMKGDQSASSLSIVGPSGINLVSSSPFHCCENGPTLIMSSHFNSGTQSEGVCLPAQEVCVQGPIFTTQRSWKRNKTDPVNPFLAFDCYIPARRFCVREMQWLSESSWSHMQAFDIPSMRLFRSLIFVYDMWLPCFVRSHACRHGRGLVFFC